MLIMLLDGPGEMTWEADSYAVLFSVLVKTEERIFGNVSPTSSLHTQGKWVPAMCKATIKTQMGKLDEQQGRPMTRVLVWASELRPERKLMSWVELRQDRVDPIPRPHGQETQLSAGLPSVTSWPCPMTRVCILDTEENQTLEWTVSPKILYAPPAHAAILTSNSIPRWGVRHSIHVTESHPSTRGTEGYPHSGYILRGPGYISGVPVTQQENGMLPGKGQ